MLSSFGISVKICFSKAAKWPMFVYTADGAKKWKIHSDIYIYIYSKAAKRQFFISSSTNEMDSHLNLYKVSRIYFFRNWNKIALIPDKHLTIAVSLLTNFSYILLLRNSGHLPIKINSGSWIWWKYIRISILRVRVSCILIGKQPQPFSRRDHSCAKVNVNLIK